MSTMIQHGYTYEGIKTLDDYIAEALREGEDDAERLDGLITTVSRLIEKLATRTTALSLDDVEEIIGVYDNLRYPSLTPTENQP
jgi:hypothetical protein